MSQDNVRHLHIFLNAAGLEVLARGGEPYYWDYRIVQAETGAEKLGVVPETPKNCLLVASFVPVTLPTAASAAPIAVAELKRRKAEVYAQAQNDVQELDTRINNLLALSYTPQG